MFVILAYDIEAKRVAKVMKTVKKYLKPVQKSVYEGYISVKNLNEMKSELIKIINPEHDGIILYKLVWGGKIHREILGKHRNFDSMIL